MRDDIKKGQREVHWDFCEKNGWCIRKRRSGRNEEVKVLWDINFQSDNVIEATKSDIIVIDKKERKRIIIDIALPADVIVVKKEREKVGKKRI